jgi:molecular chaperone Hsp33
MSITVTTKTDQWTKCISANGTIRAVAVSALEASNILSDRHKLTGDGQHALAECIVGALLLASYCKGEEKINLNIQGSGWIKQSVIDANANGDIRGYVVERDPAERVIPPEIGPWGTGLLSVLRTKEDEKQPYIGTVPILTGYLGKDLTFYWVQSEQVPSAVGIFVQLDGGKVTHAEGVLVQALPGATDEDLAFIESQFKHLGRHVENSPSETPTSLLAYLLQNQSFSILEQTPISFRCSCSIERVKRSISLIGNKDIQEMIDEGKADVTCDFCAEKYTLSKTDLQGLLSS